MLLVTQMWKLKPKMRKDFPGSESYSTSASQKAALDPWVRTVERALLEDATAGVMRKGSGLQRH